MTQITPQQLNEWLADAGRPKTVLVDVREPLEFQICRSAGSLHIQMNTITASSGELAPDADTVLICHHGSRSFQAGMFLERAGFSRVFNLDGGVDAWAKRVEPDMPAY
jgi:rhodanese-related sulfurtransferase